MSSAANADAPYAGASGSTRTTRTTILCSGCGALYGGTYHVSLRAGDDASASFLEDGFSAVNRAECPDCGALHVIEEALVFHDVPGHRLILVVPDAQRHRVQQLRAALLVTLAEEAQGVMPAHVFEPMLVVGVSKLKRALRGATAAPQSDDGPTRVSSPSPPPVAAPPRSPDAVTSVSPEPRLPAPPVVTPAPALRPALPPPPTRPRSPLEKGLPPPIVASPLSRPTPAPAVATRPAPVSEGSERETLERSVDISLESAEASVEASPSGNIPAPLPVALPPGPRTPAPPPPGSSPGGQLIEALGRRTEPEAAPVPQAPPLASWDRNLDAGWNLDSTESPAIEDPTHVVRIEQMAPPLRKPTGPLFEENRASGRDAYLRLDDRRVQAVVRLSAARANAFHSGDAHLGVQLHQTTAGPVVDLLLTAREGGEVVDHVAWVLDPDAPGEAAVIEELQRDFLLDVVLHLPDGAFLGRRTFHEPLGPNLRSAVTAWRAASRSSDPAAARRLFEATDFDRVGRLKHNFHEDSFIEVRSASEAQLALGILSYWSAPERRDYLVRIKSFPETWLETIARRVLHGALEHGLSMEPHLRQRAIDLKIAESSALLVKSALANFAEVCLNLKGNGLDPLDVWDNWESLLALADELDVRVEEEIEELAALAMERARESSQANESAEFGADDAGVEMVEVGELGNMGSAALSGLLSNPNLRADAALALLHRGDAGHAVSVADAMRRMTREQLQRVVPAALSLGPAFEGSFLGALRSKRASLRLAAALFLAEIRSERAVGPLLELVLKSGPDEWQFLARAAARMGRRIIAPAVRVVAAAGDDEGRVAFTLALLGTEARGALAAALDRDSDARVHACLTRAMERAAEVSFGDPADFSERLADAFATCRSDTIGPDFDEDLESVDLGPAASAKDLETDVDLDGLDEPKTR